MARNYEALREERLQTVDPAYRQLLEARAAAPAMSEIGVETLRSLELPENTLADGVTSRDVDIPGPAGPIPTRIFTPEGLEGPLGVFVHFHGGGFVFLGGLDTLVGANSRMALEIGCVVVCPDFRLPPEHKFPAALEDCYAVARWVGDHAEEQGWDPDRIAVGGGCTGGSLAATVSLIARDEGAPRIALQWMQVAMLDLRCDTESQYEFGRGYALSREDNEWCIEQYLNESEERWDWRASPLLARSFRDLPPALVVVGEWDILRDEGRMYADRLEDAGVEVIFRCYQGQSHIFAPGIDAKARQESYDVIREFIGSPK